MVCNACKILRTSLSIEIHTTTTVLWVHQAWKLQYRSTVLSINNHVMGVIVFDVVLSMLAVYTCIG